MWALITGLFQSIANLFTAIEPEIMAFTSQYQRVHLPIEEQRDLNKRMHMVYRMEKKLAMPDVQQAVKIEFSDKDAVMQAEITALITNLLKPKK